MKSVLFSAVLIWSSILPGQRELTGHALVRRGVDVTRVMAESACLAERLAAVQVCANAAKSSRTEFGKLAEVAKGHYGTHTHPRENLLIYQWLLHLVLVGDADELAFRRGIVDSLVLFPSNDAFPFVVAMGLSGESDDYLGRALASDDIEDKSGWLLAWLWRLEAGDIEASEVSAEDVDALNNLAENSNNWPVPSHEEGYDYMYGWAYRVPGYLAARALCRLGRGEDWEDYVDLTELAMHEPHSGEWCRARDAILSRELELGRLGDQLLGLALTRLGPVYWRELLEHIKVPDGGVVASLRVAPLAKFW